MGSTRTLARSKWFDKSWHHQLRNLFGTVLCNGFREKFLIGSISGLSVSTTNGGHNIQRCRRAYFLFSDNNTYSDFADNNL